MATSGIEELYQMMNQVFGLVGFEYRPDMAAADVPGWDSLHHTMLMLEIEQVTGVELSPYETSELPNIGALWDMVSKARAAGT